MSRRSRFASTALGLAIAIAACQPAGPTQTPAAPPTAATGAEPLVVATTANYPPFEYYGDNLELTGFDIELMRAIGTELGRPIEFEDHAFDGLIGEVELGLVDAAIAALSITPARMGRVSFSDVYYVGVDAVLGAAGAPPERVASAGDLAAYRVGVEHGSVYEEWLRKELVNPGLMPASRLLVYGSAAQAVSDLSGGRVEAVVLDRDVADGYLADGGVRLAGTGVNAQRLAIAVAKGSDPLLAGLNSALATLERRGDIARLMERYDLAATQESETSPTEVATPMPSAACIDGMDVVESVTLDDQRLTAPPVVQPGEGIRKVWRVRNTGTCTWDDTYTAAYSSGNVPAAEMGARPVPIAGTVDPGATYEIAVDLAAPLEPAIYQAVWELRNSGQEAFGERLMLAVQVAMRPTATPPPTQTPVPDVTFAASPTRVAPGERVVFEWSAPGAQAAYFYAEGRDWRQYPVRTDDQRAAYPEATISYFLRVVRPTGAIEEREARIEVVPDRTGPQIAYFSVLPESNLAFGQCAAIQWGVEGDVSTVAVYADGAPIWAGAPRSGYVPHCPAGLGTVVYAVEAAGPGGTGRVQYELDVVSSGGNPGPTPAGPTITAFSATPARLSAGGCVRLYWKVGGSFERVQILRNTRVVLDNAPPAADTEDCSYDRGTVVYSVKASDAEGHVATRDATVTFE